MTTNPLLETKKVTKTYGGIPAIDAVDFDSQQGEVHALMGENGAGKSNLRCFFKLRRIASSIFCFYFKNIALVPLPSVAAFEGILHPPKPIYLWMSPTSLSNQEPTDF